MIVIKKILLGGHALLLATVLGALSGCREAGPTGVRERPGAAAGSAPSAGPSGSAEQESGRAASREDGKDLEEEQARTGPVLLKTTAEQLRAGIKARGKKATLVNAWASWCGPCRREVPMLQALAANLKPQGVQIMLVTVDDPKDEAKALSFLKDNGITLESYIVDGSIGDFKAGINPRWPGMLPASFLFDGNAELAHFWGGEAFENEMVPLIDDFLAGRPIKPETRYGLAPGKVN